MPCCGICFARKDLGGDDFGLKTLMVRVFGVNFDLGDRWVCWRGVALSLELFKRGFAACFSRYWGVFDMKCELNESQKRVLDETPIASKGVMLRAFGGRSRAAGIKAFCLACVGYVRRDVSECTALGCPLHAYRPFQEEEEGEEECGAVVVARVGGFRKKG
jgi:hypothetical protein